MTNIRRGTVGFIVFLVTRMFELSFKKRIKSIGALRKNPEFFEVGVMSSKIDQTPPGNGFRTFSLITRVIREKVRNPLPGGVWSILEDMTPTSKNSGFFLRAPIDLILFLNESSNILVTRKTMKPTVPRLMLVKNRCYNKILSFFQNIMYAPL